MSETNKFDIFRLMSPEIFESKSSNKVYRKRSVLFRYKLRIFCSLHRPVSWKSRLYHLIINALIFFSCVTVNIFDDLFGSFAVISMAITDLLLACILSAELMFRLWSSGCVSDFKGFYGKIRYLKSYAFLRGIDISGIMTFITFIYVQELEGSVGIFIRLLHVGQVFQVYRQILPLLKLMKDTIMVQFNQLSVAYIFASIIFTVMSFAFYLKQFGRYDILDSIWFTYVTLTTIGFGDIYPKESWSRALTLVLGFWGICVFQLPASIFGTGLAIKLRDEQKRVLFQFPAANLIQTFWMCYATHKESKHTSAWIKFKKKRTITEIDKQCIRFILKFRYFRARRQFMTMSDTTKLSDDSEQKLDLLRKLSLIESTLNEIKSQTYKLKDEYESIYLLIEKAYQSLET